MTRKPRAVMKQMERLIESALMPGRFISHHADFQTSGHGPIGS